MKTTTIYRINVSSEASFGVGYEGFFRHFPSQAELIEAIGFEIERLVNRDNLEDKTRINQLTNAKDVAAYFADCVPPIFCTSELKVQVAGTTIGTITIEAIECYERSQSRELAELIA